MFDAKLLPPCRIYKSPSVNIRILCPLNIHFGMTFGVFSLVGGVYYFFNV